MIYTLADNAVSSLHIAIEYFIKLYYFEDKYCPSEVDEAFKICIEFLENAVELLLKTILVNEDALSIYKEPNSTVIKKAMAQTNESTKLEDILISEGNFKTIQYSETVEKYNNMFRKSKKLYKILEDFGDLRNAITHFGINRTGKKHELVIDMLNVFDIIYNYLYPQLIEIDSIKNIFISDDLIVETVHGLKPLFDDNYIYNNVVGFLDELLEGANQYALECRYKNPEFKINEFVDFFRMAIKDKKLKYLLGQNQLKIVFDEPQLFGTDFSFDIMRNEDSIVSICSSYSRFFNATAFFDDAGLICFIVVHDKCEIYLYNNNSISFWPESSEAEPDMLWLQDFENGICKKLMLSKNNIIKAFDAIITSNIGL